MFELLSLELELSEPLPFELSFELSSEPPFELLSLELSELVLPVLSVLPELETEVVAVGSLPPIDASVLDESGFVPQSLLGGASVFVPPLLFPVSGFSSGFSSGF